MTLYFTDKQVPEMSALGDLQRRAVRHGAFDLFCKDHPPARWRVRLANCVVVLIGFALGLSFSSRFLFQLLIAVGVVLVTELFFQSFLTDRLRPYFRRYVEEHPEKISRAA